MGETLTVAARDALDMDDLLKRHCCFIEDGFGQVLAVRWMIFWVRS